MLTKIVYIIFNKLTVFIEQNIFKAFQKYSPVGGYNLQWKLEFIYKLINFTIYYIYILIINSIFSKI